MISTAKLSTVQKIWTLLTSTERRGALALAGLMVISMMLETIGVGLVIPTIALLTQSEFTRTYPQLQPVLQAMGNPSQQALVIGGMLMLVGVYLIKFLFLAFLAWRQTHFTFGLQTRLSQRLFTVYVRQPYTFHLQRNSAQLMRNVTSEVNIFTYSGIQTGMTLVTESLVLFGLCSLLLIVEPLGALIVVSVLGIAAWGFHHITRKRIEHWGQARQYHDGLRIQHLQQGLGGAKDVKLLGREADFLEQYRVHDTQSARVGQLQSTLQQLPRLWLELLAVSGIAILATSMLVQNRALEFVLPTLGLFAVAAFRLIPSVNRVLSAVQSLRYGLAVIDILYAEFNLATPEAVGSHGPATSFGAALELSHITYAYPGAAGPALKDISLTIQCGESVGFIGASGAGKSTLVDVLLGLLAPDTGNVKLDGKDIQANLRNWQDQIGYVPQSIYLTDDTLRRNVAFGLSREEIDDAAVQRAIQAAQLEDFVASLPDGLETVVGERGIRLSGGQCQRIGIARALYHDPAVLVLDEATSSLDTETERDVMQAVRALHGRKTVVIVAHRLSTVEHCDKLYRLQGGKVVEAGAPDTMVPNQPAVSVISALENTGTIQPKKIRV
jgi:ABC-type multidrug transport system fused ATPase/permease subunit